jgi:hypothetical protein
LYFHSAGLDLGITELQKFELAALEPGSDVTCFPSWWCGAIKKIPKDMRKGFNTLVILVAWEIRKHQNACVLGC